MTVKGDLSRRLLERGGPCRFWSGTRGANQKPWSCALPICAKAKCNGHAGTVIGSAGLAVRPCLLVCLSFSVLSLHLNSANKLVGTAIAQLQKDLTEGLWLPIMLFVIALDAQGLVELVNRYIVKLYKNLS
jgi:hypothetical protein